MKVELDEHYKLMRTFISDVSNYIENHPIYEGVNETNKESIKDPLYAILGVLSEKHRLAQDKHILKKRVVELLSK